MYYFIILLFYLLDNYFSSASFFLLYHQLFRGDVDEVTVRMNKLKHPVGARFIRFIPTSYVKYKVLRVEVYGKRQGQYISDTFSIHPPSIKF